MFYPDSGTGTASRTANTGFASKAALTNAAGGFNLIVPLNKYSFFAASQDVVHQTGKMELNITLERDEMSCTKMQQLLKVDMLLQK